MASQSESLGSQDSSRSEDETPTTSDEEFIVSDSEMEEVEQAESEEDDIELLYESFINLREENKLKNRNSQNKTIFSGKFTRN